jgi:hypothetical protein
MPESVLPATEPNLRTALRRFPNLGLLIALVALLFIQSFLSSENQLQRAIVNAVFFITVLSAIRTLSRSRFRLWSAVSLGAIAYFLSWVDEIAPSRYLIGTIDVCFIALFLVLIIAVAENVFGDGSVDTNRIIGAVTIYLLLGIAWAFCYALVEIILPGSFEFRSSTDVERLHAGFLGEFLYFSNITLTTLGYGDVVPVSPPARMLASLEAMVGQLYVAIVIARLVGLRVSQATNPE